MKFNINKIQLLRKHLLSFCVSGCLLGTISSSFAQSPPADSLKIKLKAIGKTKVKESIIQLKSQKKTVSQLSERLDQQLNDRLNKGLDRLKKPVISMNLAVENSLQYQPAVLPLGPVRQTRFADIFGVTGTVNFLGIPLNINVSSGQSGLSPFNSPTNNLFKFDFDPKQYQAGLQSELQRFNDLRRDVFAGEDLTGYTHQLLADQLQSVQGKLQQAVGDSLLRGYLNNPAQLTQLMNMSEEQIKMKLKQEMAEKTARYQDSVKARAASVLAKQAGNVSSIGQQAAALNTTTLQPQTLMGQSLQLNQLPLVKDKLTGKLVEGAIRYDSLGHKITIPGGMDSLARLQALLKETSDSSAALVAGGQSTKSNADLHTLLSADKALKDTAMNRKVDSVAATISRIKKRLERSGFSVARLLQVQQLNASPDGLKHLSEAGSELVNRKRGDLMQSMMSKLKAFKLGSFGNQVPGSTQNQDLFMNGTHATFNLGHTPLTIGYGSQNDVGALKDMGFQNTIYNSPRNLTYMGTELKGGWGGKLKVSIIGSVNKQYSFQNYQLPTVSSNNVALTLSKLFNMGAAGNVTVDVSKSTTLYSNNYSTGSDALLDRKSGFTNNLNTELFQSLAISMNHRLDIKELDMSDNVYFSYSGMGYQNPGNNGFGGAQLKAGGSLKKTFYKNKLMLNVRSDIKNQPISYTSNDQWQNFQVQVDSRYLINKKFNVALKYINNHTDKKVDNVTTPVYAFQKVQFDGNAVYKIGKHYSISHFTIGGQSLSNSYVGASSSGMMMLNYTQSVVLRQKTMTLNVFYNRELSGIRLIGNMLNTDLTYQVPLSKKVSLASAVTYLDNTGIAQQAGIRESITVASFKHFDIGSYIDLRKNLITPQYADLYAATRAELTVKYHINY